MAKALDRFEKNPKKDISLKAKLIGMIWGTRQTVFPIHWQTGMII